MARVTRRLALLRHAKSAWPDVPDQDRPLAGRGRRDAPVVGRWLRDSGLVPDLVLCSTATRATQTWELASAELGGDPAVSFEPGVYAATADSLLRLVRRTPGGVATLLLVGHDPGVPNLALLLAGSAADGTASGPLERIRAKYPTAAVAVLEFAGAWSRLGPGQARLTDFAVPRELRAAP
jgi:phosphohistidine phosphatase